MNVAKWRKAAPKDRNRMTVVVSRRYGIHQAFVICEASYEDKKVGMGMGGTKALAIQAAVDNWMEHFGEGQPAPLIDPIREAWNSFDPAHHARQRAAKKAAWEGLPRWWVSWYATASEAETLSSEVIGSWTSGQTMGEPVRFTVVVLLAAKDEAEARAKLAAVWPRTAELLPEPSDHNRCPDREDRWRFFEEKPADFTTGDRFKTD